MVLSNRWIPVDADLASTGEHVPRREWWQDTGPLVSGYVFATYFTADKSETVSTISAYTVGAAAATPTLCRMGIYSVAANGNLTLAAACANDTTLFASANTAYARTLTVSLSKVAGQRYAAALIVVTGTTMPTMVGHQMASAAGVVGIYRDAPPLVGIMGGQTDLPSSISAGSLATYSFRPAFKLS